MREALLALPMLLCVACMSSPSSGTAAEADPCADGGGVECWCPGPPCEKHGCVDGVAWNCLLWGGDGCWEQVGSEDCAAQGKSCWSEGSDYDATYFCAPPGCGDGIVQAGESCDEGSANGTRSDGCTAACTPPPPGCGDGIVQAEEACDDGAENGTRIDGCTTRCTAPVPALLDQHFAAPPEALEALEIGRHAAFQTFTPARSGRLAKVVTEDDDVGLFALGERDYEYLGTATPVLREVDGHLRREHHFFHPVHVEAGRTYGFSIGWPNGKAWAARGDGYAGGGVRFLAYPGGMPPSPAPADADVPFETWVIEADDGCRPEAEPRCIPSCEEPNYQAAWPSCVAGVWSCGDWVDRASCIPRHELPLMLVASVEPNEAATEISIDRSAVEPLLVLRPAADLELARIELPGLEFRWNEPGIAVAVGPTDERPRTYLQSAEGHRPGPGEDYRFDFLPPLLLEAGGTYAIPLDGVEAIAWHEDPGATWASFELQPMVGHEAPALPDGAVVPVRLWRLP